MGRYVKPVRGPSDGSTKYTYTCIKDALLYITEREKK